MRTVTRDPSLARAAARGARPIFLPAQRSAEPDRSGCPARPDRTGTPRHGDRRAYKDFGCTCPDARDDYRIYRKRLRERRAEPGWVSSLGTVRRVRALACIGYSGPRLAAELGIGASRISHLRVGRYPTIRATQAAHIAQVYERLSGHPLLDPGAERTRREALRRGWASPIAWEGAELDDPAAHPDLGAVRPDTVTDADLVDALGGQLPATTPGHRRRVMVAVVARLTEQGLTVPRIAERLGVTGRTVQRARATARGRPGVAA